VLVRVEILPRIKIEIILPTEAGAAYTRSSDVSAGRARFLIALVASAHLLVTKIAQYCCAKTEEYMRVGWVRLCEHINCSINDTAQLPNRRPHSSLFLVRYKVSETARARAPSKVQRYSVRFEFVSVRIPHLAHFPRFRPQSFTHPGPNCRRVLIVYLSHPPRSL
jgi:hypothetical protein